MTSISTPYDACIEAYAGHGPNALWEAVQAIVRGHSHERRIYETGYAGAVAFDNASPYAPVSILVCPTARPYLNFEHFAMEAGTEAVGLFMQAVCRVATRAVQAFDAAVVGEAAAKRADYEQAFARLEAAQSVDDAALQQLVTEYVRDSNRLGFALRDLHAGHSGYRVAFNNGTGATGMSQPHMHAQIVGGRYLGGIATPDPSSVYPPSAFMKVANSLMHRAIKGTNQ